jgi:glycosyltransferase involved in cell wall biosynthesis
LGRGARRRPFVAKTQADFSKFITKLINNPTLCSSMGKAAHRRTQNFFSWKKAALKYQQLLGSVAERT